ncbi:MAG: TIGR04211 family SH3 domain-containing protein [Ectothiorhodospiraceae bacterium]
MILRSCWSVLVLLLIALLLAPGVSAQEQRYISDELELDMRSGPGNQYRIQSMLPAGTPVEVLEEDSGWTRVRPPSGDTGWVLTRLLSDERSAQEQLEEALEELESLRSENDELEARAEEAEARVAELEERLADSEDQRQEIAQRMERAEQGLDLYEENEDLKKELVDSERRIQDLEQQRDRLKERDRQHWFLVGAAVVIVGFLAGLILPRLGWRRRSSGWSGGGL